MVFTRILHLLTSPIRWLHRWLLAETDKDYE